MAETALPDIIWSDLFAIPQVLHPQEVVLKEEEALVWFPGWEHETRIQHGLSISLSLHFDTVMDSLYIQTFKRFLQEEHRIVTVVGANAWSIPVNYHPFGVTDCHLATLLRSSEVHTQS